MKKRLRILLIFLKLEMFFGDLLKRGFYQMLVVERGWSSDEYEKWLAELLIQVLLSKPEPPLDANSGF